MFASGSRHLGLDDRRAEPLEVADPLLGEVVRLRDYSPPTHGAFRRTPTLSPASRGSGAGRCASTDHMSAVSSTVVAIGPATSSVGQSG